MNKKILLSFVVLTGLLFSGWTSYAQSVVNVDPLTGAGSVVIPIYSLSSGQVSLPVSLTYTGNGVKPKDVEGSAGMGWQLQAGGQISRVVRGLPDDVTKDNAGNQRLGWMSPLDTAANLINGFTVQNDGGVTCSKETTDISNITADFPFKDDTEPDLFFVSAPGLSCELVFNRADGKFHPVSYQDLVITYTLNANIGQEANQIASFTITNDKGITYLFGATDVGPGAETVYQYTLGTSPVYSTTQYNQYKSGINYYDSWALASITDANGNGVQLTYTGYPKRSSRDSVAYFIGGATSLSLQYLVSQSVTPVQLATIQTINANSYSTQNLSFSWVTDSSSTQTGQTIISGISGFGRNFQFTYSNVSYAPTGYSRQFLRNLSDGTCSTPINYTFVYAGESISDSHWVTTLPDSGSHKLDYWGYYSTLPTGGSLIPSVYVNPSYANLQRYMIDVTSSPGPLYTYTLANANRNADPTVASVGSLTKITYATGGNTNIVYEPNDYYDVSSGIIAQGSGIRVKQIIDSVASASTNNIIRNYTYLNPSTGTSSGKPISLPAYAFTTPYTGTATGLALWTASTVLSAWDLSHEDHTIMYAYSKVSQTGAGSTQYQYFLPATYWDLTATPVCTGCTTVEWKPTINYSARNNCSATYGPVKNDLYSYPFIPNTNYDFERGLPESVITYNDNPTPQKVSETDYTYVRSYSAPDTIAAFKFDNNQNDGLLAVAYNKYKLYYGTSELTATVTKTVYDSQTLTQAQSSSVSYSYASAYHKLLSQQTVTNSDNSIVTTNYRYIKDYPLTSGSTNANVNAIYNLQLLNINAPVETYQTVTRGSMTVYTGASLNLFSGFTPGSVALYLPSEQLKMVQPDGASSFSPLTVGSSSLTYDTKYFPVANYETYEKTGLPLTVDDNNKNIQTTVFDHLTNQVTASFKQARYNEVAFNDFDSQVAAPTSTFTISGTGFMANGSHAGNAYGLYSTQTVTSGTLSLTNSIAQNYIFSIWINAATAGTLTLTLTGISTHPSISYTTGGWAYYELKIPVGTLSSSYTVSFVSSQNISIDDILFYPDIAEVTTATYDPSTHYKIAQTNTNGVSAYFTSDEWGRLLLQRDQDQNIVLKKSYITSASVQNVTPPVINYIPVGTITTTTPVTFSCPAFTDNCSNEGTTYTWNYGDGSAKVITTAPIAPAHTYTAANTYTVTLSVFSPYFGTKVAPTVNITVVPATAAVTYHATSILAAGIDSITFSGPNHYAFTNATLPGTILPGTYTVTIYPFGSLYNSGNMRGYTNMVFTDGATGQCFNYTGGNFTFSWTVIANHTLDFAMYNNNYCPFP